MESLEKEIEGLETYRKETERSRQRRLIGTFLFYSFLLYGVGIIAAYLLVVPQTASEYALLGLPVVALPSLFWLAKVALGAWYYRLLASNDHKLIAAKERRKQILDEVKETETYKVAQELLERYDPGIKEEKAAKEREEEAKKALAATPASQLRQRRPVPADPTPQGRTPGNPGLRPAMTPQMGGPRPLHSTPYGGGIPPFTPGFGPRLPKPLLNRERSNMDKLVDFIVGDGPSHRFALVCSQCRSHNGMCPEEEFQYFAFRCAYCHFFNPARTQRPIAPKLTPPQPPPINPSVEEDSEPPTEPDDGSDNATESEDVHRDSSPDSVPEVVEKTETVVEEKTETVVEEKAATVVEEKAETVVEEKAATVVEEKAATESTA